MSSSDSFLYKHQNHINTKNLVPETCNDNGDVLYKANGDDNEVDDKEGVVGQIIDSKNENICSDGLGILSSIQIYLLFVLKGLKSLRYVEIFSNLLPLRFCKLSLKVKYDSVSEHNLFLVLRYISPNLGLISLPCISRHHHTCQKSPQFS